MLLAVFRVGRPPKFIIVHIGSWIADGVRQQTSIISKLLPIFWLVACSTILMCGVLKAVRGPSFTPRAGGELLERLFEDRWVWLAMWLAVLHRHSGRLFPGLSTVVVDRFVRLSFLLVLAAVLWPMIRMALPPELFN
jgi:hypothetical protein